MSHLPPPCLPVKLHTMENKPFSSSSSSELTPTKLCFPTEFPYEFDSVSSYSPGFTSPGDSTETEDESSDDEEDFLAGLTRRLAPSTHRPPPPKAENPTLSGLGSFSNAGSQSTILPPPPQPPAAYLRRDNAYDVISAAAGEVAKLKMGSYFLPRQHHDGGSFLRRQNSDNSLRQQRLLEHMLLCSQTRIENHYTNRGLLNQEAIAFENLRLMRLKAISNSTWLAGAPVKKPSVGTGVFLPRRYPTTNPSETLKKPGIVNAKPMLQSRVHQQNLDFDEFVYGRSSGVGRQGSVRLVSGGGCLPQDWMY